MAVSAYSRGSVNNPTAIFDAQKDASMIRNESKKMPGYEDYYTPSGRRRQDGGYGLDESYADKFAGQFNPNEFMGMFGGGGDGDYGPIGASDLKEFGEGAYELFDKFRPGMEYIAENQGVSEAELATRLGESSGRYAENVASQEDQMQRSMGRMGIDPTSGAYAAGAGQRGMGAAAGLSELQNNVRSDARGEDWQQRMEAAGIGLNVAGQGTNALSQATGAYGQALSNMSGMYGDYMSGYGQMLGLDENARQYGMQNKLATNQFLSGSVPAYQNMQMGGQARSALPSQNSQWQPSFQ